MSWVFASGGQSPGTSALASVLPMNIQGQFPLVWTGLISLPSEGLSRGFSSTIRKHQFFNAQPSLWSSSHTRSYHSAGFMKDWEMWKSGERISRRLSVSTWRVRRGWGWRRLESRDPQAWRRAWGPEWGLQENALPQHCSKNKVGNTSISASP